MVGVVVRGSVECVAGNSDLSLRDVCCVGLRCEAGKCEWSWGGGDGVSVNGKRQHHP